MADEKASVEDIAPGAIARAADITDGIAARIHRPVLLDECVDLLLPAGRRPDPVIVDCTLGLAGHSLAFCEAAPAARLIGIDRDKEALELAARRLSAHADRFTPVHASFARFAAVLDELGIDEVDGAFLDLGLSSLQIDEKDRGFAYSADGPLDMRMDAAQPLTAADVLASYSVDGLTRVFRDYGQERWARRIAQAIAEQRQREPLEHASQLVDLIDRAVPRRNRPAGNPAKRVFQALRIEVNGELDELRSVLPQIALRLAVGGRIVVESYHSLEDRITKRFFARGSRVDMPRGMPQIPEGLRPYFRDVSHGAVKAGRDEIAGNPRSGSVRLRAIELTLPLPPAVRNEMLRDIELAEQGKEKRR